MSEIRTTLADGALEIVMDRPARKNALTVAMYAEMAHALSRASHEAAVRAVLVRGASGVFTSGNDLHDFMDRGLAGDPSPVAHFLDVLASFDKPIVAAVEGHAIGIGTTMLLHCDLVYAAESARFRLPFVNLALVPEAASSYLLPRLVGHARAAELLYFGDPFDAPTAKHLGIVNAVVPSEDLLAFAREKVAALVAKPPEALKETKRLLKAPLADETRARMRAEFAAFAERLQSTEATTAITAFFEKRRPSSS
ncbi:MAG: enoyl-CoA hydratase [Myxococcota bacterium]|nr:enoyl-CoA hydratase [Myxococcota bacterium]